MMFQLSSREQRSEWDEEDITAERRAPSGLS
jgi:hypothetical protein